MKLSQMTTDKAADVLVTVAPELQAIINDTELLAELRKSAKDKSEAITVGLQKIVYLIPAMLGKYRPNIYTILGVIHDKTPDEIGQQGLGETIGQVKGVLQDEELLSFFQSSAPPAQKE